MELYVLPQLASILFFCFFPQMLASSTSAKYCNSNCFFLLRVDVGVNDGVFICVGPLMGSVTGGMELLLQRLAEE